MYRKCSIECTEIWVLTNAHSHVTTIEIQNSSISPANLLTLPYWQSHPQLQTLETTDMFSIHTVLPFPELPLNRFIRTFETGSFHSFSVFWNQLLFLYREGCEGGCCSPESSGHAGRRETQGGFPCFSLEAELLQETQPLL